MKAIRNEQGSIIVFATLMIVLLLIMVGMGLDMGQLTYVRNQGQAAVDAAALAAVSALPSRDDAQVKARAAAFNSKNNYVESPTNAIGSSSVSYVQYDFTTGSITNYNESIATANGVRVALEGGNAITTPMFLTPLLNLLGISTASTKDTNVSAVATIIGRPSIPIALWNQVCESITPGDSVDIKQQNPGNENSCWTCFLDNSCGASDIKALFKITGECTGWSAEYLIDKGTYIYENKGQAASVYDVVGDFFFQDHPNRCWLIPVIVGSGNCNAKNPEKIVDFASICPTGMVKNGAHSYIRANVTCNQKLDSLDNSLCFTHRLVRQKAKNM
jgi:Flp pilus assembly protein TadG